MTWRRKFAALSNVNKRGDFRAHIPASDCLFCGSPHPERQAPVADSLDLTYRRVEGHGNRGANRPPIASPSRPADIRESSITVSRASMAASLCPITRQMNKATDAQKISGLRRAVSECRHLYGDGEYARNRNPTSQRAHLPWLVRVISSNTVFNGNALELIQKPAGTIM
jgi:hypothetical protein